MNSPAATKSDAGRRSVPVCAHCGLPVPPSLVVPGESEQFCCSGCHAVFRVLRGAGLLDYYDFRERLGEGAAPAAVIDGQDFGEFDSEAFQSLYLTVDETGQAHTELYLEGVHCAACVWLVERLPKLEPAVESARLNIARSVVELTFTPLGKDEDGSVRGASLSQVARALSGLGYRPRPARGGTHELVRRRELRSLLVRIGVAGACAGNVMLMAFALYSGGSATSLLMHDAGTMNEGTRRFFEWASLGVSLPSLWAGSVFFRGAWSSLRARVPHMDLPIALGIGAGFMLGVVNTVRGVGEIYFDSITTLTFFLLVGRYLQRRHQMRASDAAELLSAVTPSRAWRLVLSPGEKPTLETPVEEVETFALAVGDCVSLESGQVASVDGQVALGRSSVDRSLLSGESVPIEVSEGSLVEAGCLNLGRRLILVTERAANETRVAKLMREVERTLSTRAPMVQTADRWAGVFTLVVILLAVSVFIFYSRVSQEVAFERALALLIVACPCALGMATPLSLSAAVSQAARTGKLVFGGEAMEAMAKPALVLLDKTGTLTVGKLRVVESLGSDEWDEMILWAEGMSAHPVAQALTLHFQSREVLSLRDASANGAAPWEVEEILGQGLVVTEGGRRILIGSERFVGAEARIPDELGRALVARADGAAPVLVAAGGEVVALFFVADAVRADARESLLTLKAQGHELALISGDHPHAVQSVAAELSAGDPGFFQDVRWALCPEEKLAYVQSCRARGQRTIMVGDGVNDAGALAAAHVGVAVSGASEAAQLSAGVFLKDPGVSELAELLVGARRTLHTVYRGIGFSLAYNALGISLAAAGILGPLEAAILMPISSITVVTNAYKSRMFKVA